MSAFGKSLVRTIYAFVLYAIWFLSIKHRILLVARTCFAKQRKDQRGDGEQITDDVYRSRSFDNKDFVCKPIKSDRCTIDENVLQFHHSFGYDCRSKMFNICAADDRTIVYAAGNYIGTFDVNDGVSSFRKCAGNGGVGHIARNPIFGHLAIGENGSGDDDGPLIIVYEWPTFEVVSVLRGSAERQNVWLNYNRNGQLLCSQAGEPDHTLTIWDWKKSVIVLRTKSRAQDVRVCRFSTFIDDQLVTAGSGHVEFWKMTNTFTGLKLKGRLGRFGKMQTSDIIGIFAMPDEKVVSGCDWGNILVWDEDVVDVQVMRKGRNPCHSAPIVMFLYSEHNAELTSVSMDGTIKFWYYRTADTADPADNDDRVIEMEPSFTINVQDSIGIAKIMGMCKANNDPGSNDYFIQDGNGGMWLTDIEVSARAKPLRRLAKFHGDEITSLQTSPVGYFIATTSLDGWFHVYNVADRKLMFTHNFNVPITSSIWLPLNIASSGNVFIIGFQTGILKIVAVPFKEIIKEETLFDLVKLQSSKPHTDSIRHLAINCNAQIVVCGSDDCSIFIYKINTDPVKLNPIGMYPLPGKITFIHWKPSEKQTVLISCASGHVVEVNEVPTSRPSYTTESFLLKLETRVIETVNIRHRVFCDQHMLDIEYEEEKKMDRKKKNKLEIIKEKNPCAKIVDDLNFKDSSKDNGSPKTHVHGIPNPVLFAIYTPSERTLWVSIDGFNAGFLYEYDFDSPEPINATVIPNKNNISLTTIKMFGNDPLKVLMGFADGRIRVTNIKVTDIYDLNDYIEYAIHDNKTGRVKMISSSHDDRMLFTYGDDGNIFSFMFQCDNGTVDACMNPIFDSPQSCELIEEDIIKTKEDLKISLEERKINKEKCKALNLANKEKDKIRCVLYGLKERFKQVLLDNESLPESLRFSHDYFQFDERFNRLLIEEAQSKMDKLHLKLAFDYEKSLLGLTKVKNYFVDKIITAKFEVKAISKDAGVKTIYHEMHYNSFEILLDEFLSKKPQRRSTILERTAENPVHKITESEIFLRNIREIYPTLPKKIQSSIDKFAARIEFENQEILKIKNMYNEKPINNTIEENATLSNAWKTIGDLNLKTATDFKLSDDVVISLEDKFKQYVSVRKEIHDLKSNFNEKVFNLRQKKIKLINDYKQFKFDTDMIRNELNDSELTTPADYPEILIDDSIDPNLIDKFELPNHRHYSDPTYLFLNNLYDIEMSENEEPTSVKATMRQLRRSHLKHRHECLHESMLTKITVFDNHLLALDVERKDVKIHITFLDLFAMTLEEEMIILNDFDWLEDENLRNVHKKMLIQNEKINQITMEQKHIANYNEIINNNLNKLIDIQHTFDIEVRNNNFAKYLKYIFKKKLRIPKVKSDNDDNRDDSLSSSSSDESDESEPETDKDLKRDSLATINRFTMLDENVLPVGCDPKLFALTFELRSQRHAIEQSTENTKKMAQLSNKNLNLAYAKLNDVENDLKENLDQLETYKIKKLLKLNQVEVTVLLNKSQMCKAQLQNSSVLVNGNVMQVLANRVTELKKETDDIKYEYTSEKLNAKQLRTEINAMEQILKNYKVAIRDEMIKKFRIETDWSFLDDMEMAIINYMIVQAKSRPEETKERFINETKLLENQIRVNQDILTDLIEANTTKTLTLKSLFESIRQLQQDLSLQPKNYETFQNISVNNANKDDMIALKNVYDILTKRKLDICAEINALKYKGKMFPPIATRRARPSVSGQRDDDDGRPTALGPMAQEEITCSLDRVSEEENEELSCWTTSGDGEDEERQYYEMEFNVEPRATTVSKRSSSAQWSSWVNGGEERDDGWVKYDEEETADEDFEEADTTFEGTQNEVGFDECRLQENNDYVQPRDEARRSSTQSSD